MKKFKSAIKGFTLVELLIVIGLLGAIALIVISAINPIEQANRARDTRYKADGGQIISAIDRYFVGASEYPWMTLTPAIDTDDPLVYVTASDPSIGICGATCTVDGLLTDTNELKTEFRNRDFLKTTASGTDLMWVGKAIGSSTSVYACFVPLSKSVREKACNEGKVYTLATSVRTQIAAGDAACGADSATWTSGPQYICIPE